MKEVNYAVLEYKIRRNKEKTYKIGDGNSKSVKKNKIEEER